MSNKLNAGQQPFVSGTDYPTQEGTCIRDYFDVRDVARAHHVAADSTATLPQSMNVGTGRGGSVREIIRLVSDAVGLRGLNILVGARIAGDHGLLNTDNSQLT